MVEQGYLSHRAW